MGFSTAPRRDDPTVAETLRLLFPGSRRTARLSKAFERSRTSMEEIMAGRNVPRDVRIIVGLLRSCPREHWPHRWKEAATDDGL
jgi:lambda repressor-like predicted transcriptional regulator